MKKYIIVSVIGVLLIVLAGYSVYSRMASYEAVLDTFQEQQGELEQELQAAKDQIDMLTQDITLRNILDDRFYQVLRMLKDGDAEGINQLSTDNIVGQGNKILNNKQQIEFKLPRANYFFRQRCFGVDQSNKTIFTACYEFYPDMRYSNIEKILELYVDYHQVEGEWKIYAIYLDGLNPEVDRY